MEQLHTRPRGKTKIDDFLRNLDNTESLNYFSTFIYTTTYFLHFDMSDTVKIQSIIPFLMPTLCINLGLGPAPNRAGLLP